MNKIFKGITVFLILSVFVFSCNNSNVKSKKEIDHNGEEGLKGRGTTNLSDAGKLVYNRNCKVCHQMNAKGVPGIYPPIVNTKNIKGDKNYLIEVLLNGQSGEITIEGEKYNGVMASFRNLSDEEIADVLNYLRSKSEGKLDTINAEDVKTFR